MRNNKRNAKGEGSFKINKDGTVTHRKGVGFKTDGHRKTLTVTAPTKAACIREMRKKENEWIKRQAASHVYDKDTVVTLCLSHLNYQVENGELKPKSIDRREVTIQKQIGEYDLGILQVGVVTSVDIVSHINRLMRERKVGASSIGKALDVLNAAYDWAVRRGDLESNPVYPVKNELKKKINKMKQKTSGDSDVDVLEEEEINDFVNEAMMRNAKGEDKYPAGKYCLLLLYTGMRIGEMLALRWKDWDGNALVIEKSISMTKNRGKNEEKENNYIPVEGETKNQKARIIDLTDEAKWILQGIKEKRKTAAPEEFIVVTKTGKPNTASNMEHRMKIIMKNAGLKEIKGGLHIFRKTFATQMYENGARVEEIAAYIGDLESTTRKYYIAIRKKENGRGGRKIVKLPKVRDVDVA